MNALARLARAAAWLLEGRISPACHYLLVERITCGRGPKASDVLFRDEVHR